MAVALDLGAPDARVLQSPGRSERSLRSAHAASTGRPTRVLRRLASGLSTALVALAAVAFLLLAVGPHVLGYRTATMLTGSMAPGINPGDVVGERPPAGRPGRRR